MKAGKEVEDINEPRRTSSGRDREKTFDEEVPYETFGRVGGKRDDILDIAEANNRDNTFIDAK